MLVSDFDYDLPEHLIAQEPCSRRDLSQLLVVKRGDQSLEDAVFERLPSYLSRGDLLVLNNTRVFPARLIGRRLRKTSGGQEVLGGRVEVFLVREIEPFLWEALVRPGRSLLPGARVEFGRGKLTVEVVNWMERGRRVVRFTTAADVEETIDRIGRTPLPPYIKRDEEDRLDAERYQTIFARKRGAVAAPTAGLHFTPELLERLRERGIEIAEITLHVGYGTFQPVLVDAVEDHRVEPEGYEISEDAAGLINCALEEGRRIIAVGTTTTRALESAARSVQFESTGRQTRSSGLISAGSSTTDLFIYPGFQFRVIGGLITNFHLPRSSLLMLVSAFAGRDMIMNAYRHAIERGYRFYSYGDAMLVL